MSEILNVLAEQTQIHNDDLNLHGEYFGVVFNGSEATVIYKDIERRPQAVSIQTATIIFTPNSGATGQTVLTITESDILSLTVDRTSVSGNMIEIGSAVAAECKLTLRNADGKFSSVLFEGGEIDVTISVDGNDYHMGKFIIDDCPRPLQSISINALDRMILFDREVNQRTLPPDSITDIKALIRQCCTDCGVTLQENGFYKTDAVNRALGVSYKANTSNAVTYRELIQSAAMLFGGFAMMNPDGRLEFRQYSVMNDSEITAGNRYVSDVQENDIRFSGIRFEREEPKDTEEESGTSETQKVLYRAGVEGYEFDLSANLFLQSAESTVVSTALRNVWSGIQYLYYRPFSATIISSPWIMPGDGVRYIDSSGNARFSTVTSVVHKLNASTEIESTGETKQNAKFKRTGITSAESKVIEALRQQVQRQDSNQKEQLQREISAREQAVIALNEALGSAKGLYSYKAVDSSGGETFYLYDTQSNKTPPYKDSKLVIQLNTAGLGISLDGGQTYTSGFDFATQTAIMNVVQTVGVQAEWIKVDPSLSGGNGDIFSAFQVTASGMISDATRNFITAEGAEGIANSTFDQKADGITVTVRQTMFDPLTTAINDQKARTDGIEQTINSVFQFRAEGLVVSKEGSPFATVYANDRVSFTNSGAEVAYISGRKLFITDGEFLNSVVIGNFMFKPQPNGNLSFIKYK